MTSHIGRYRRTHVALDDRVRVRQKIVETLQQRVVDDATGASLPPYQRYTGPSPTTRFWLGTLIPEAEVDLARREFSERLRPPSQGISLRIDTLPARLKVSVSFCVWVTLHPAFGEQQARAGLDPGDSDAAAMGHADPRLELASVRMKIPVTGVTFDAEMGEAGVTRRFGSTEVSDAVNAAFTRLPAGTVLHRPLRRGAGRPRLSDLHDERAWQAWERDSLDHPARPAWRAEVDVEARPDGRGGYELLIGLVNRSPAVDKQYVDPDQTQAFTKAACDPVLYEAILEVTPGTETVDYELAEIPDSYRYDRRVPALGWNAAVEQTGLRTFVTAFAAVATTNRVYPRTNSPSSAERIDTSFQTLASSRALDALRSLTRHARSWTEDAWHAETLQAMATEDGGWGREMRDLAKRDASDARAEISWVENGVALLEGDPRLEQAFKLMNNTMARIGRKRGYDSWHPFQIAFIAGCLPALIDTSSDQCVDILWFPTGGGKTEAYLGLTIFSLFYGRLVGRTSGTQVWARFPLRLLSLQQTQRFADSILIAEAVRSRLPELAGGDPFGIGYYVGQGNTPNRITLPGDRYYDGWDPFDRDNAEACRVLERCPLCGRRPEVEFNPDTYAMEHRCTTGGCELATSRLPVFVIDDDIHRNAPSVLAGTVDKLVSMSWQKSFRHLLGRAYGRCERHGYSSDYGRCSIWGCDLPLQRVPRGFGGIRLEVQDELHLLSESLGALDGNYETLFQAIRAAVGLPPLRIVGATATIEGYVDQCQQLYTRRPRRFPLPGPRKPESFWAFENDGDPLRTYVALLPRGATLIDAAFRVTLSHRQFLSEALADPARFCSEVLGEDSGQASWVAAELLDLYEVLVCYALRKQELERYRRDVTEDPRICSHEGHWDEVSGDVEFWDIRDVLNRLEAPPSADSRRIRVLGATSAISHGVDVNRLNVMCVMGMPSQTSEFIQATARIGRKYPGLVMCLINPMRRRDVSHYRYFAKYAEYLDRLVERVPVNRESLPVLERVLPGGFMAWLLQVDEPAWLEGPGPRRRRLWQTRGVAQAIDAGHLDEQVTVERLRQSFAVDPNDPRQRLHDNKIGEFVERTFIRLPARRGADSSTFEELRPPPPTSMRDVESAIVISGEK